MADWVHDLGGSRGFGPVEIEPDEPPFHADWERRVFGMTATVMARGRANGSEFRHAIERMDPGWYLHSSYYEHWLTGLATLLVEKGLVEREELAAHGASSFPPSRRTRCRSTRRSCGAATPNRARRSASISGGATWRRSDDRTGPPPRRAVAGRAARRGARGAAEREGARHAGVHRRRREP